MFLTIRVLKLVEERDKASGRDQTGDLNITSVALYQLSYEGISKFLLVSF